MIFSRGHATISATCHDAHFSRNTRDIRRQLSHVEYITKPSTGESGYTRLEISCVDFEALVCLMETQGHLVMRSVYGMGSDTRPKPFLV